MSQHRSFALPVPRRAAAAAPFTLADFLRVLETRRGLVIRVALATVVAAVLVAFSLPTIWTSSAVVMLDTRKNTVADASAVLTQLQPDPATLQNQIQILQSRDLAQKVITNLKLYDDPEFNGTLPAPGLAGLLDPRNWGDGPPPVDVQKAHDQIMDAFLRHVSADANGVSTAITITATARDPAKAARIANAMAQAYVDDQVARRHDADAETTGWLQSRVDRLGADLQQQDEAIQRFKARNGIADAGTGTSLVDQQMLGINNQIVAARSDLDQKLAAQQQLQALGADTSGTAPVLGSLVINALKAQQADLARQEADLSSKYGPLYPRLQAIQAQRKEIDQKVTQEMARISGAAGNDVAVARQHLASLESALQRAEQLSANQNLARSQLAALESDATSTRNAYESFLQRLRAAQDQDAGLTPESRIISPAALPSAPSSPKRKLIVGASLPLGALLGVLAALLMEKFAPLLPARASRRRARAPARREPRWESPPVLGEIANAGALRAADYVVDWPSSRFAHASAALARQLAMEDGDGAVVALTAAEPGDAKSVVAVAIARAAARMGKRVVIVDCDPARRAAAALQARPAAGLYEVLTGAVPLNRALARDPRGGAWLLTLTQRPAGMAGMFASPQMARLLDILRDNCDLVVLDCGIALSGPEAGLIAAQADATLLVCRREKRNARSLMQATRVLEDAHAAPIGMVLAS